MSTRQKKWFIGITATVLGWVVGIMMAGWAIQIDQRGNWFSLVEVTQGEGPCVKLRPLGRGEKVMVLPMQDANDVELMYPRYRVVARFPGDFMPRVVELATLMFSENEDAVGKYGDITVVYWKDKRAAK